MDLFGLATYDFDNSVRNTAIGNTIGNAVCHGHHQQREESRDCNFNIAPFDVLDGAGHHDAYDDEDGSGSAGGNKTQQRHSESRQLS